MNIFLWFKYVVYLIECNDCRSGHTSRHASAETENQGVTKLVHYGIPQWWTQKLFAMGADEVFNHIFKGYGRVFCLKYTLIFFSRGVAAHPDHYVGPPMVSLE
ncbi:hypothetical protein Hanom_Chr15g01406561 [Helianthus anomalus]